MKHIVFALIALGFVASAQAQTAAPAPAAAPPPALEKTSAEPAPTPSEPGGETPNARVEEAPQGLSMSQEEVVRSIIAQTTLNTTQALANRTDFYWGLAGTVGTAVIAILGFLGLGQLRDLRSNLRTAITNDLKNELLASEPFRLAISAPLLADTRRQIDASVGSLEREITFIRLQRLSEKVNNSERIAHSERDAMIEQLLEVKQHEKILKSSEFLAALEIVLDNFYAAGLWRQMDSLDAAFAENITNHHGICTTFVGSYAMRLFGEPVSSNRAALKDGLLRYAEALMQMNYPERALPRLLGLEFFEKAPGWQDRARRLVGVAGDIADEDKIRFYDALARYSDATTYGKTPTSVHHEMARLYNEVMTTMAAELQPFAQMSAAAKAASGE